MNTEDPFIDDRAERKLIEEVREDFPDLDVVSSLAFVVKAINSCNRRTLVVATEHEKIFWVLDFVRDKEDDYLQGLLTAIHVIAQEKIAAFWRNATKLKESKKIMVLAVHVSTYFQRGLKIQQ